MMFKLLNPLTVNPCLMISLPIPEIRGLSPWLRTLQYHRSHDLEIHRLLSEMISFKAFLFEHPNISEKSIVNFFGHLDPKDMTKSNKIVFTLPNKF
ncbi:hypothetical protein BpHYR1_011448 [Brachionus plicatilis]|uniref:Uncharacterized protein n=1 Tax=Brachionus plicatilis TaxID=10195 RepID=A0A3M7QFP0_BRAPC|nr:hypothetical protein BpHYR1_011448 [Brachionus plicatilis]